MKYQKITESDIKILGSKTKNLIETKKLNKEIKEFNISISLLEYYHTKNYGEQSSRIKQNYLNEEVYPLFYETYGNNESLINKFENKFINNRIFESRNSDETKIVEFFDFMKKGILYDTKLVSENQFRKLVSIKKDLNESDIANLLEAPNQQAQDYAKKMTGLVQKTGKNVMKSATKTIKGKPTSWWSSWLSNIKFETIVETFREIVNGTFGQIAQIILALTGVGNIINWIANGFLLAYDLIYQGFMKGNWQWYNIISSALSLVGTAAVGALAKPLKPYLSKVANVVDLGGTLAKLSKTPVGKKVGWLMQTIAGGLGKALGWVKQGLNFVAKWIPGLKGIIGKLSAGIGKAQKWFQDMIKAFKEGFAKHTSSRSQYGPITGRGPNAKTFKQKIKFHPHFDKTHIMQKAIATGDKLLAKEVAGKTLKHYFKVPTAGFTFKKIISKYKLHPNSLAQLNATKIKKGVLNPNNLKKGDKVLVSAGAA